MGVAMRRDELGPLALKIKTAEDVADQRYPRTRMGPKIEPPWSYWLGLAGAYLWMVKHGITHISEREQ